MMIKCGHQSLEDQTQSGGSSYNQIKMDEFQGIWKFNSEWVFQ
jgi:hypothetical protein